VGRCITLKDEDDADEGAIQEELNQQERDWGSRYFDPDRGWVHTSMYPYNVGQCERTSGPSHVVDDGGVAAQRSSGEDRSRPVQDQRFRAGSDSHNVGTDPEDSS
jgi:hypothetical protein